jgi:3-hydroxybutyrate dehydrogenase
VSAADTPRRCALVTGSTNGLGLAIASALARSGCDIVLSGVVAPAEATQACAALAVAHGIDTTYVQADLSSHAGAAGLVERLHAQVKSPDILVNNAVVRHFAPIESFPTDAWDRSLAVNVSAAFDLARLLLPAMRARGWGRIVNMTSIYSQRGAAERVDYVTTKSALLGLTRAIALETVGAGITCNAVAPGSVLTDAIDARIRAIIDAQGVSRAEAERRFLAGKQPTGRFVQADHVADLVVFLCGPSAGDITGAMIPMDGGWLAS